MGSRRRRQRGQSTIEVGVSSIVLLLLLFGALDFGRAAYQAIAIHNAVREAARHGAWFDVSSQANPYLDAADIKAAVDQVLGESGLGPSLLQTGCPAAADGNTKFNPPFRTGAFPSAGGAVWLYLCLDFGNTALPASAPPSPSNPYWLKDLDVIVLVNYAPLTAPISNLAGQGIYLAASQHILVQGHP